MSVIVVGAAAYSPELAETKSQYLGSEAQFNVYAAEVTAINMAVDIAKKASETIENCVIYTDSQPAIIATTKPVKQSGQSIIAATLNNLESLQAQKPDLNVSIIWIPGHMEIPGNEKADEEAKKAAVSNQSRRAPFNHKPLKSARNRIIKETTNQGWEQVWKSRNHNSRFLRRITTKQDVERGPKLYNRLTKRGQISQLARLRTGHCSLN
jgi:ribonuclease HI